MYFLIFNKNMYFFFKNANRGRFHGHSLKVHSIYSTTVGKNEDLHHSKRHFGKE